MRVEGSLQIGEVAEAVGLSIRTIRHYDELGLVEPSGRSPGRFRLYTAADVERLRLVKWLSAAPHRVIELLEQLPDRAYRRPVDMWDELPGVPIEH